MGDALGHDERFALFQNVFHAAHGEFSLAVEHGHHGIAAGGVGGDLLALVEGENGHADQLVLHERLADDLSVCVVDQISKAEFLFFFNVFVHVLNSFFVSILFLLHHINREKRACLTEKFTVEMVWILPTRVRFVRNSTIQFSYLIPESALFEVFDSKKEVFKTKILKTSVASGYEKDRFVFLIDGFVPMACFCVIFCCPSHGNQIDYYVALFRN